jgi:hypothetical protein
MHAIPLLHPVPAPTVPEDWSRTFDLAAVRSPGDLPPWFAVGALDLEAFSSDARGWCARWADDAAMSSLLVEYHRPTRRARVRTQFLGSNPLEATVVASLQEQLLAAAFDPMPPGCDGALLRALGADAVALPPRYGHSALWAPFGSMLVMALPLHALRIDAFRDWMAARPLRCARDRVQAWVGLCASQLRYNEQWRPFWFDGIEAARAAVSTATGLPAGVEPAPLRDGRPGWLVERPVYAAFMLLPMAGVPALVADLRAAGFLASREAAMSDSGKGAGGLEMEAFLVTTAALEHAGSLALQFGEFGLAEVHYTLTPCGSRVPWPEWLKYATRGGVASLPAPLQLPTPASAVRH